VGTKNRENKITIQKFLTFMAIVLKLWTICSSTAVPKLVSFCCRYWRH